VNETEEEPMTKRTHSRSWWLALPVLLLVVYFLLFRPREDAVTDTPVPIEAAGEQVGIAPGEQDPVAVADAQLARDREFINMAFPILSRWDLMAVKPLLSDVTVAGTTDEQLTEVMTVLADRLGELISFDLPMPTTAADEGEAVDGSGMLKHYQFAARYAAGVADVDLVLHQKPEASSLYSFNINVPN
jgi:hypothetical protein